MSEMPKLWTDGKVDSNLLAPSSFPNPTWEWVIFGNRNLITVTLVDEVPWWRRTLTRIFLGSKWRKLS